MSPPILPSGATASGPGSRRGPALLLKMVSAAPMVPMSLPVLLLVLASLLAPILPSRLLSGLPRLVSNASAATPDARPHRTIRVVVPWADGASPDAASLAGPFAQALAHTIGKPVLLDHRPGLDGALAAEIVANAPPDGHTILLASGELLLSCLRRTRLTGPGCNVERDLAPITLLTLSGSVLVTGNRPDAPASFSALASPPPVGAGKPVRSYASAGFGSSSHLAAEHLRQSGSLAAAHRPHADLAAAAIAVARGGADVMVVPLAVAQAGIRDGSLRPLAVTGGYRSYALPAVPHLGEFGTDSRVLDWHALWSPRKTPVQTRQSLQAAVAEALDRQEILHAWNSRGAEQGGQPMQVLELLVRSETLKWTRTIHTLGNVGIGPIRP